MVVAVSVFPLQSSCSRQCLVQASRMKCGNYAWAWYYRSMAGFHEQYMSTPVSDTPFIVSLGTVARRDGSAIYLFYMVCYGSWHLPFITFLPKPPLHPNHWFQKKANKSIPRRDYQAGIASHIKRDSYQNTNTCRVEWLSMRWESKKYTHLWRSRP